MNPKDLVPHREIPRLFPHLFTDNQWDWTFRNRDKNGLDDLVYDVNGHKLVDLPRFPDWVETRRETNLKSAS